MRYARDNTNFTRYALQTDVSTFKHNKKVIKKFSCYIMDVTLIAFIVTN